MVGWTTKDDRNASSVKMEFNDKSSIILSVTANYAGIWNSHKLLSSDEVASFFVGFLIKMKKGSRLLIFGRWLNQVHHNIFPPSGLSPQLIKSKLSFPKYFSELISTKSSNCLNQTDLSVKGVILFEYDKRYMSNFWN